MTFQSLFNNFYDSINLSDTNSTNILKLRNSLLSLRDTTSNNNWLFDLFSFTNHVNKSSLWRVDDSTTVNQDKISILRIINHFITILSKLSNHELTVRDVMWTTESLHKNTVSTRCFFTLIYTKITKRRFILLVFFLFMFLLMLILCLLDFFLFYGFLFSWFWCSIILVKLKEISGEVL